MTNYTNVSVPYPQGIVAGPDGAVWFANQGVDGAGSIARITTPVTPGITSFTPTSGKAKNKVTIVGENPLGRDERNLSTAFRRRSSPTRRPRS